MDGCTKSENGSAITILHLKPPTQVGRVYSSKVLIQRMSVGPREGSALDARP